MNIRKTYRMQQLYYNGFSFLPIHSVQKHNYFLYKVYTRDHKLYPLFQSVLNKEVLDNHYIITIRKAIINNSGPLTQAMMADLEFAQEIMNQFFDESPFNRSDLPYAEGAIRTLLRALNKFTKVEQKLTDDLTNLLSGGFTNLYKINTDQIDNILDVLHQVYKGIRRMMKCLSDFCVEISYTERDHQPALKVKACMNKLSEGLERWCRVHKTIIFQVQEWRSVRAMHERQEVLN